MGQERIPLTSVQFQAYQRARQAQLADEARLANSREVFRVVGALILDAHGFEPATNAVVEEATATLVVDIPESADPAPE